MANQKENVLTDHAYDGIQEYDNPMPGWWVWGFILSIVFAFPYWAWYHMNEGRGIYDELEADMAAAEAAAGFEAPLEETREAMLTYLEDPAILEAGQRIFSQTCFACHAADGGGMLALGPNFTDDAYKNTTTLEGLIGVVREGVPGTAMIPNGGAQLTQQQQVKVAVYIASLRGTTPANPLPPEGEVLPPWK